MKPSNAELVTQLQAATEGLLFPSENEYPFKTFVFEVESQENFTVDNLLKTAGFMRPVNLDDFLQFVSEVAPKNRQNYEQIINLLQLFTSLLPSRSKNTYLNEPRRREAHEERREEDR